MFSWTIGGKYITDIGNIFVDMGILQTLLSLEYYSKWKSVMSNMIIAQLVEGVEVELDFSNVLCYNNSSQFEFREVTIYFRDAYVKLSPSDFYRDISIGVMCSIFRSGNPNIVYDRIMQINLLIDWHWAVV